MSDERYAASIRDIPMPARIAKLPIDERGFPVPWFVAWIDADGRPTVRELGGKPDFRVVDASKLYRCIAVPNAHCWVCGEPMGQHRIFSIGPMCAISRTISEPPAHRECAEYAVRACPFLARPRMRRNENDIPEAANEAAGVAIKRNPGVTCLWETRTYKPFHANGGVLFRLGDPVRADWWTEGRTATRAEVMASIDSGFPLLLDMAKAEGTAAVMELNRAKGRAMSLLPLQVVT